MMACPSDRGSFQGVGIAGNSDRELPRPSGALFWLSTRSSLRFSGRPGSRVLPGACAEGSSDPEFSLATIFSLGVVVVATWVHGSFLALPMRVIRTPFAWHTDGRKVTEIAAREVV
jgi:hypothetical protein